MLCIRLLLVTLSYICLMEGSSNPGTRVTNLRPLEKVRMKVMERKKPKNKCKKFKKKKCLQKCKICSKLKDCTKCCSKWCRGRETTVAPTTTKEIVSKLTTKMPSTTAEIDFGSTTTIPNEIAGCNQHYNLSKSEGKIISSPGFLEKQNYPNNVNCKWTFTAPPGEKVSMTILDINTESGYDVVRVMDGIEGEDGKLSIRATMSGEEKQEAIISSTSKMTITFTSDINVNMTGFQAHVIAFKKDDLPEFTWIDLYTLNIKFPNGKNETIPLSLEEDLNTACIFKGQYLETSVMITSPLSTKECKSLDQQIEIILITSHLKNTKNIYIMKNGQLKHIQEHFFENNEIIRKRNLTKMELPRKIKIPIQFAFDKGLENKFSKYDQDKSYIKKRITEIYYASKYSLKNILNETNVEFILEKNILFINEVLELNQSTLLNLRKFQVHEDIPLVVLCAEDYINNVKGLSFRSGACRKNRERFGTIMLTWRDDGGLAADVLEHELGHVIGAVHNKKNATETHVGHTDFNSENINAWFSMAGHRCYGKNCSSPPAPTNGSWICDSEFQSCFLKCDRGFSNMSLSTIIECENGNWSENIHEAACFPTVIIMAGGARHPLGKVVEVFYSGVENIYCQNKPPSPTLYWDSHITFSYHKTMYLCGGANPNSAVCQAYNYNDRIWATYPFRETQWGHSSVVVGDTIFVVGGANFLDTANYEHLGVIQTQLPMEDIAPDWTPVKNLPYKGVGQCSLKIQLHKMVIIGGYKVRWDHDGQFTENLNENSMSSRVTSYNVDEGTIEILASLVHPRGFHGCVVFEEAGSTWILVTGGSYDLTGVTGNILKSTELLNLRDTNNAWISKSSMDLNEARASHGMAVTEKGPIVIGGYGYGDDRSIELFDWDSQTWIILEQSLTTDRYSFGDIIELPSHLLNCKLNIQTVCPDVPNKKNGKWTCDSTNTTCMLTCHPGFTSSYTTTSCIGGVWKDISKMECTESVFLVAGGEGAERNVEIFHPEVQNLQCSSIPSHLDLDWYGHTSFTHQGKIYLCEDVLCASYSHEDSWTKYLRGEDRGNGFSSLVNGNTLFLIGGESFCTRRAMCRDPSATETILPIGKSQIWTDMRYDIYYEGTNQCSIKIGINRMAIIGGNYYTHNGASIYQIVNGTTKSEDPGYYILVEDREQHGCISLEGTNSTWILVTGGYDYIHARGMQSTEIVNLSDNENKFMYSGNLTVGRYGHGMALTAKGPIVVGGQTDISNLLKSIEIFNMKTQTWSLHHQSLSTSRSMYGNVIEMPGILFGCQIQPINITGCTEEYHYNKEFIGGSTVPVGKNETCHSLCQNEGDCLAWTWTQEKQCWIIEEHSALESLQAKTGSISGLKNSCKPKCYLVLAHGEEASTNTQFCSSENIATDCSDMIHMEPDDFQEDDDGNIMICHEDEGVSKCEDLTYGDIHLVCNPDPGVVTLSTVQRINKHFFSRNLTPHFAHWGK